MEMLAAVGSAIITAGKYVASSFVAVANGTANAAQWATYLTVAVGAPMAANALIKPKIGGSGAALEWRADVNGAYHAGYGRFGAAGQIVFKRTYGADLRYFGLVTVLSLGPIAGFVAFDADDERVTFDGSGKAITSQYRNELWMQTRLGMQPETALTTPTGLYKGAALPSGVWTAAHRTSGKASYMLTMEENSKRTAFPKGEVKPRWTARGLYGWDPRLDSTYPGGSGPCRLLDPTTWVEITCPIIAGLNWSIGIWQKATATPNSRKGGIPYQGKCVMGIGSTLDGIDVDGFVTAANAAQARNWKVSAYPGSLDDKRQVLDAFLQAGGAVYANKAGKISCISRAAPRAAVVSVSARDTAGPIELYTVAGQIGRKNGLTPSFWDEQARWEMSPLETVTHPDWIAEDGGERVEDHPLHFVPNAKQARELTILQIANTREGISGVWPMKPYMQDLEPGEAFEVTEPGFVLSGMKLLVLNTDYDPATCTVRVEFCSETDAKYPFAYGQSSTPPTSPSLTPVDFTDVPAPDNDNGEGGPRWVATGGTIGETTKQPAIIVQGQLAESTATHVIIEYRKVDSEGEPVGDWTPAWDVDANQTVFPIAPLEAETSYEVAVRYRHQVSGRISDALFLAPVTTGKLTAGGVTDENGDEVTGDEIRDAVDTVETFDGRLVDAEALAAAAILAVEDIGDVNEAVEAAALSASNAAASEAAAIAAAANAIISEGEAQDAAADALARALAAAGSATSASGSATSASGSATAAAGSATTATTKAGEASTSAAAALASKVSAESARDTASGHASASASSASAAATSATNAATSASSANTSATTASTKAAEASTSATNASNSATSAAGSAATATSQANLAATARDNAQGHATAAAGSATTASGFATAAQTAAAASQTSRLAAEAARDDSEDFAQASSDSASTAAASASDAASSASAAQADRIAAQTARTGSETARSGSEAARDLAVTAKNDAQGAASAAAASQTLAATSATNAGNAATASSTSASLASTKADEASASATAANTFRGQAEASALSAINTIRDTIQSPGFGVTDALKLYTEQTSTPVASAADLSAARIRTVSGVGPVYFRSGAQGIIGPKGLTPVYPGRTYRVIIRARQTINPPSGSAAIRALFYCFDSSGGYISALASVGDSAATVAEGWRTFTYDRTFEQLPAGTVFIRPAANPNQGTTTGEAEVAFVLAVDITDALAAETFANASFTYAGQAQAYRDQSETWATASQGFSTQAQTQAGLALTYSGQSATARDEAVTARNTAGTHATNAGNSATTATTQAGIATTKAAEALASSVIAAQVGGGSMNPNPVFADWSSTLPANWTVWAAAGTLTKIAGINGSPNAMRAASSSASPFGYQNSISGAAPGGEWLVVEGDITLVAGSLQGTGLMVVARQGTTTRATLTAPFHLVPDASGVVRGSGAVGSTYRFRTLIDARASGVDNYILYAVTRRAGEFNAVGAATIDWHRASARPATAQEIATNTALPALEASVAVTQGAVADIETQVANAYFEVVAAAGGNPARLAVKSGTGGSLIALAAQALVLENVVNGTVVKAMELSDGRAVFSAPVSVITGSRRTTLGAGFGVGNALALWSGPTSVAYGSETVDNGVLGVSGTDAFFGGRTLSGPFDSGATAASLSLTTTYQDIAVVSSKDVKDGYFGLWPEFSTSGTGTLIPSTTTYQLSVEWQVISTNQAGTDVEVIRSGSFDRTQVGNANFGVAGFAPALNAGQSDAGTKTGNRRIVLQARRSVGNPIAVTNRRLRGFYSA